MTDDIVELMNELIGYLNEWAWVPDERKDLTSLDNLQWIYKELYDRERQRQPEQHGPRAMVIIRILVGFMGD
jgi:hypothetical protein